MASALGQLSNAPLIYVLAQIVFTRVPKMGMLWEDFHQAIFDRYPHANPEHIRQLQLDNQAEPLASELVRWNIVDRSKREGVILSPDSLVFHATSYKTSNEFFRNLEFVLSELAEILPKNVEINRLGLRYIDLLLPNDEFSIDDQVAGKLGSVSLDDIGCEFNKLEEVTSYKTPENGVLVIRHRQSTGTDILPSDVFPNNLRSAPLLESPKPAGVVGLMDYDHYVHLENTFETSHIMDLLRDMHSTSSQAFKKTTTPDAQVFWGKE